MSAAGTLTLGGAWSNRRSAHGGRRKRPATSCAQGDGQWPASRRSSTTPTTYRTCGADTAVNRSSPSLWTRRGRVRKRRAAQLRAEERTRESKRPRRVEQRAARAARDAEYKASLRPETPEERERIAAKRAEWQRLRALRPDEDLFRTYLRMHGTRFPALLPKTLGPAFPWLPASEDASRWE
jgi:hypothetical protein